MRIWMTLSLATLLSLGACGSSKSERTDQSMNAKPAGGAPAALDGGMGGMMGGGMMHGQQGQPGGGNDLCPVQVKSTAAKAEDVDGGVAIRFTTTGDVAEVRRRVTAMVAMHAAGAHGGKGMGGMAVGGNRPAMAHHEMMAADAKVEEIEGGARVVFTPKDPAKLEALRSEVRDHAVQMSSTGECPMMMHAAGE